MVDGFAGMAMHIVGKWLASELTKDSISRTHDAVRLAQEKGGSGFEAMIVGRIAQWLGMETANTAATSGQVAARVVEDTTAAGESAAARAAASLSGVNANAAVAASGAYAAIAMIPYIGPALAPGAEGARHRR